VRDAGDAVKFQHFCRRSLVIRYAMRHGAVQSNIISKREVPPGPAPHNDKPTLRSDLDGDAVVCAVLFYGFHEGPLAFEHF
jgi:hypothetical protein